ncbi:MAG TPA: MFS transporter [Candidatus Binatia bacterium]|nr:MFS transporter [Candidatus Binatia bacterium]
MTRAEKTYYGVYTLYCLGWSFTAPMYALFLLSRGLDLFQINVVLATYLIVSFLFEVPTGALADLFGRKRSFLLSCVVRALAFVMYYYAHSFRDCITAELVDAVGTTLANGALDAWAIDSMRAEGHHQTADRFFARAQMISRSAMIGAGIVGGYVAAANIAWPWLIGAGFFCAAAATAIALMSETAVASRTAAAPRSLIATARAGLRAVRRQPVLLWLSLITLTASFGMMPVHQTWQPRMKALSGEGLWLMGWIWALVNVAAVTGSAAVPRLLGRFARERMLVAVTAWRSAAIGLAALATAFYPALAGLLLFELGFGVGEPLVQAWMNEHVGSEQRATVLSVRSMAFMLGGGTGLLCLGLVAREVSIAAAWALSSMMLLVSAAGYVVLARVARGRDLVHADNVVKLKAVG